MENVWVARHWTNNNAESINHIIKLKADWRQQPVSSCVDNIYDLVKLQCVELRSARTGRGNFTLSALPGIDHGVGGQEGRVVQKVPTRHRSASSGENCDISGRWSDSTCDTKGCAEAMPIQETAGSPDKHFASQTRAGIKCFWAKF